MNNIRLVDMHCDTLTRLVSRTMDFERDNLNMPGYDLTLENTPKQISWAQFYAIFTPERFRGQNGIDWYEKNRANFVRLTDKYADRIVRCETVPEIEAAWAAGKRAAVLTVENASVLAGDLSRIARLRSHGVRVMSLTWNAENELASGNDTDHGMSEFGRRAVHEMERVGIIADISHLNDAGVADFMEIAEKPFVATHSNARAVCSHKRNLTDEQIREMIRRDCLIGLNYFVDFLKDGGDGAGPDDLYRHICHFFELGAEKNLALGSDYDGCRLPDFMNTPAKVVDYRNYLLSHGISEEQLNGIYSENALSFLRKNL